MRVLRLLNRALGVVFSPNVFISYSWRDAAPYGRRLSDALIRKGFIVFLDLEFTEGGLLSKSLQRAIRRSRYFVLVDTPGARSLSEFVPTEIEVACQAAKPPYRVLLPGAAATNWRVPFEPEIAKYAECNFVLEPDPAHGPNDQVIRSVSRVVGHWRPVWYLGGAMLVAGTLALGFAGRWWYERLDRQAEQDARSLIEEMTGSTAEPLAARRNRAQGAFDRVDTETTGRALALVAGETLNLSDLQPFPSAIPRAVSSTGVFLRPTPSGSLELPRSASPPCAIDGVDSLNFSEDSSQLVYRKPDPSEKGKADAPPNGYFVVDVASCASVFISSPAQGAPLFNPTGTRFFAGSLQAETFLLVYEQNAGGWRPRTIAPVPQTPTAPIARRRDKSQTHGSVKVRLFTESSRDSPSGHWLNDNRLVVQMTDCLAVITLMADRSTIGRCMTAPLGKKPLPGALRTDGENQVWSAWTDERTIHKGEETVHVCVAGAPTDADGQWRDEACIAFAAALPISVADRARNGKLWTTDANGTLRLIAPGVVARSIEVKSQITAIAGPDPDGLVYVSAVFWGNLSIVSTLDSDSDDLIRRRTLPFAASALKYAPGQRALYAIGDSRIAMLEASRRGWSIVTSDRLFKSYASDDYWLGPPLTLARIVPESETSRRIVVGNISGEIGLYNLFRRSGSYNGLAYCGRVTALEFEDDGKVLVAGCEYGKVYRCPITRDSESFHCDPDQSHLPLVSDASQSGCELAPTTAVTIGTDDGTKAMGIDPLPGESRYWIRTTQISAPYTFVMPGTPIDGRSGPDSHMWALSCKEHSIYWTEVAAPERHRWHGLLPW